MAPTALPVDSHVQNGTSNLKSSKRQPVKPTGALDKFEYVEVTPVIGREYEKTNIVDDILNAPNADDLLQDLALAISQRGVVFFRAQDNLTNTFQKTFIQRLGLASGKPASSTLHIHPVLNDSREFGVGDNEISTISSAQRKSLMLDKSAAASRPTQSRRYDSAQWHSDIQFENVPADYTSLRLTQLPSTGGDTLWASGYEIYDRFSPTYQRFLDGLSATFIGDGFHRASERGGFSLYDKERGSPENVGTELSAVHPVVRTNPVSGWKSIYSIGGFPKYINELNKEESDDLLKKFLDMIYQNHDLQVRFKWRNENDIAIWDNRSVFHSATFDYEGLGERFGNRAVGIGERPYFDPESKSRAEALREAGEGVA
ncbi:alpha-ketoglutarate-dependent sulfonate dioxygenase-like protein 1 [Elsinoe australis]|uniref:Alpha-ketoglutarate-dependent sulfonate dioxygenase-like protein 1 n=1 Tax=Elsinoe australis TaxID=40998 RepID=A0A4U7B169_9PEZI|nr:alpha-ketoglutarate-dependent sulfonate dioxygenase-like protein 1 [Elsinoe australis]